MNSGPLVFNEQGCSTHYKREEQYEVVEVDEELHQNSNKSLPLSLHQRQSEGVCTRMMP